MIQSPPLERPTARDLVNTFPEKLSGAGCREITVQYAPFGNINYSKAYSKKVREDLIENIITRAIFRFAKEEVGSDNVDSVILQAIDILDRICMLFRSDLEINAFVSVYIAMALLTTWGAPSGWLDEGQWPEDPSPEKFAKRLNDSIVALKSRLYRPTLDQYGDITSREALDILSKNLSPSRVESVSSEAEVEERAKSSPKKEVKEKVKSSPKKEVKEKVKSSPVKESRPIVPEKPKWGWWPRWVWGQ
jgi:hypothetical protein